MVCAHIYWHTELDDDGQNLNEKPCVELIPLENLRFDAAADWTDIVNSSPYLIVLQPMYIGDIKDQIEKGKFLPLTDADIAASFNKDNVNTSKERTKNADPFGDANQGAKPSDYQTAVVQMHIHRIAGKDWIWWTLNNVAMLTEPKLLKDVYFHGKRPLVIGTADIDPHTAYGTSLCEQVQPTQEEMNILANQRRTNVDMAMNRKFRVDPSAGDQFDPKALLSNEVGSIVFAEKDAIEALSVPDVTQSSYQEQQLLDKDFDELAGNYNPAMSLTSRNQQESYRTHQMLNQNVNTLVEFRLKTYTLTFVEPILRQLVLLEQHYETDDVVVGLAGQMAGMFQRIGGQVQWTDNANKISGAPAPITGQPRSPGAQAQPPSGASAPGLSGGPVVGVSPGGTMGQQMPQVAPTQTGSRSLPQGISIQNLLGKELTIRVNVGLNATDPSLKLQKFISAIETVIKISSNPLHSAFDMNEVSDEIFALSGYGDGKRFMDQTTNPQILALQQQVMGMSQQLRNKQSQEDTKIKVATITAQSHERIEAAKLKKDTAELVLDHSKEMQQMSQEQQLAQANAQPQLSNGAIQ